MTPPIALLTAPSAPWTFGAPGGLTFTVRQGSRGGRRARSWSRGPGCFDFFELFRFGGLVLSADAGHLDAVVDGPVSPGGAPPGSGTQPVGFDGSVSLTPGWFGPSHE